MFTVIKLAITTLLVVGVSEVSKRSSFWGGLLAAFPLVSYLGLIWLYMDTKDTAKVASFCTGVFWLVVPSLPFFLVLAWLLKRGLGFLPSLMIATAALLIAYWSTLIVLKKVGISL